MPKKKASRKSNPKIAEQIAAAVAQIPDIVAPNQARHFEEPGSVREEEPTDETAAGQPIWQLIDPHHHQKRLWLWSGVTIFVTIIVVLWSINTLSFFTDVREKGFPEKLLLERIKADTESIVNSIESENDLETIARERQERVANAEAALASALQGLIEGANAATASTSTVTSSLE